MSKYVNYGRVKESFGITSQTVKKWALKGLINYKAIQNNTRKTWLYDIDSIGKHIDKKQDKKIKLAVTVIYARVSSKKQEPDLERQIYILVNKYPEAEVIKDIGSGLNYNKNGITRLVARVCRGEISRIVVTYKDRLMRFGFELFEQVCKENCCQIVVHSESFVSEKDDKKETKELQEDLLSIVNVFVARRNGKKAGQFRRERKRIEQEKESKLINKN
jgi:predicted site-specific integrase-resolvase